MAEGGLDHLSGGGRRHGEPVEVPLADCGGCCGALDARADGECPEVDEDEEHAEPPGAEVDDEEVLCGGEVAAEEDAGEHAHP